ncbi:hypothetical protein HYH02_006575 [Chlamydomonas schloesseri]|uniref:Uncharacterized protein n=1 Tax=Chlamydomonas schloesseri TaxID=2026947 RepID=A0A835W3C3_9CHLO|nr:hypothetical protein HYH02_006575 [Chlamydomonas schloesseri]|eukprot:KAG2439047.1 hypothetical protein HYH02_006575 [Chlamydomonas schloesseri]
MMQTGNYSIALPAEGDAGGQGAVPQGYAVAPQGYQQYTTGVNNNNYSRPGGQQNVGNFITDRPSSHVMAPPGGKSSIQLGGYPEAPPQQQYQQPGGYPPQQPGGYPPQQQGYGSPMQQPGGVYGATSADVRSGSLANNYSRPSGQQNVGNFITDRPSSKVLAPPGGQSQIAFGDYNSPAPAPQQLRASPAPAPYGTNANMPPPQQYQHGPYQMVACAPYGPGPVGGRPGDGATGNSNNNYSRPGGQQNVGNFITDRPSSRVLAPPGGKSQISFG